MPRTLEQIMDAAALSAYYQDGTARWLRIDCIVGTDLHLHDEDTHDEFVIDLVDGARADDDLELSRGFEHAFDAVNVLKFAFAHFAIV